jgi:hypothetical protein
MAATHAIPQPPLKIISLEDAAVNLADEGVPVRAIARSTRMSGEELYEVLKQAVTDGKLIELPKDDWPPGSRRSARASAQSPTLNLPDEVLRLACSKIFGVTRIQSAVVVAILRRPELTKDQIHNVIESTRRQGAEPTQVKMIDVVVCHVRKRFKEHNIKLDTIWGIGYTLHPDERAKVLAKLEAHLGGQYAAAA